MSEETGARKCVAIRAEDISHEAFVKMFGPDLEIDMEDMADILNAAIEAEVVVPEKEHRVQTLAFRGLWNAYALLWRLGCYEGNPKSCKEMLELARIELESEGRR